MINLKGINGALKFLWTDRATITADDTDSVASDDNPFNDGETRTIAENIPCKLIPSGLKADADKTLYNASSYDAILVLDNDIEIPSGSHITVTDVNGNVSKYKRSSKGFTGYQSHQEIALILEEKA